MAISAALLLLQQFTDSSAEIEKLRMEVDILAIESEVFLPT